MPPRLTTDLLLLAIDDPARYRTRGAPGVVLAAGDLCERLLAGQPVPVLGWDAGESPARRRRRLDATIRDDAGPALDRVTGRLARAGAIAPVEHRVLRLFPRHGFAVVDSSERSAAERRLRVALTPGVRPDPGTAALAVLCAVSGIARSLVPPPDGRDRRRAVAEHLNGLRGLVGEPVAEVLVATRRVLRRAGDPGDGFVPVTGHDTYGDSGGDGAGGDGGGDGGGD